MLLVAFLHTLEAIVQTIFFVIFEIGLGNRVSACQIDLGCRDCTASVLFQRVRIACGSEFEVIALIVLSIGFGIAERLRRLVDTGNSFAQSLIAFVGQKQEIEKGNVVLTGDGLVGRIASD